MTMLEQPLTLETFQVKLKNLRETPLSAAEQQAFARELDQLKAEIMAQLGEEDVRYVEMIDQIARCCEIAGRLLIHTSLEPVSWSVGVLCLWVHLQLDNLEINHSAQHGAWDKLPGAERFHSERYVHNSPVDEESWRYRHNILHHSYTGQIGRDPDVTFGFFRLGTEIDQHWYHLLQPAALVANTLTTAQNMALLSSGLGDFLAAGLLPGYQPDEHGQMHKQLNPEQFLDALQRYLRKAIPNFAWNYGLFGLLAGPLFWGKVTLGTLTAALLRNIFTGFSFYTGHMVEDAKHYQAAPRNRAEWYIQQIEGTANVEGSRLLSLLMGHLNYQIEHHLFPKLPPNRLEQIAPRVRRLCETYGVRYNTGSFTEQMGSVFRRAFKFAR